VEEKKLSADTVTNSYIDESIMMQFSLEQGQARFLALEVGVYGFWVPPEHRVSVIKTLKKYGGEVGNCHFTDYGTQSWRVK